MQPTTVATIRRCIYRFYASMESHNRELIAKVTQLKDTIKVLLSFGELNNIFINFEFHKSVWAWTSSSFVGTYMSDMVKCFRFSKVSPYSYLLCVSRNSRWKRTENSHFTSPFRPAGNRVRTCETKVFRNKRFTAV